MCRYKLENQTAPSIRDKYYYARSHPIIVMGAETLGITIGQADESSPSPRR